MGILLEADYKGVVSGQESPIAGLKRAFSATKAGTQNPLERKDGETLRPMESDGQLTYEVMNRDTGMLHPCPNGWLADADTMVVYSCLNSPRSKPKERLYISIHQRRSRHAHPARALHHYKT